MVHLRPHRGRAGLKMASQFAQYAASRYLPGGKYVKAAGAAYRLGKRAVNAYNKYKPTSTKSVSNGHSKWHGRSTGIYQGKFKRPKKPKMTKEKMALLKGYHSTHENYGRVEDPNAVYIIHSTTKIAMSKTILSSYLRVLFRKAGLALNSSESELPLFDFLNSDGFRLTYVTQDPITGAIASVPYDILDNETIDSVILNFTSMSTHLQNYLNNTDATMPYQMLLHSQDRNVAATNYRLAAQIDMLTAHITVNIASLLKVQNRTAGDGATAGDKAIERVDSQPLKVKIYNFKHSNPRVASQVVATNQTVLNSVHERGISLVKSSELMAFYQNPPNEKFFSNCSAVATSILQPGDIKQTYISHRYSGVAKNVFPKLRIQYIGANQYTGGTGRSQMLMFEEKIRTAGTNPVTIQYEQEYKIGCYIKPKHTVALLSNLSVAEYNNLPA